MGAVNRYLRAAAGATLAALLVATGGVSAQSAGPIPLELMSDLPDVLAKRFAVNPIVEIRVMPYKDMRYPTAGDWQWTKEGRLIITVAKMPDLRYEQLIAFHELAEALMCKHDGVSEKAVDAWDLAHPDADEPGDDPAAPYHKQHRAASGFEHALAGQLGVDWKSYEKAIEALGK